MNDSEPENSAQELEPHDLPNPYPRQVLVQDQSVWCERIPWVLAPYASFVLNVGLALFRSRDEPVAGMVSVSSVTYPVVALICWAFGGIVALMNLICAADRIAHKHPFLVSLLNGIVSLISLLLSTAVLLILFLGPD